VQQYDFLRTAQYDPIGRRFEVKMVSSNQSAADFLAGEPIEGTETATTYWRRVPWLFRAVELRAGAVGSAPWRLMKGDTETSNSATWDDPLGVLPNPQTSPAYQFDANKDDEVVLELIELGNVATTDVMVWVNVEALQP